MASENNFSREMQQLRKDIGRSIEETGQKALKAIEEQQASAKRAFAQVADDLEKAYLKKDWQAIQVVIITLRHIATSK